MRLCGGSSGTKDVREVNTALRTEHGLTRRPRLTAYLGVVLRPALNAEAQHLGPFDSVGVPRPARRAMLAAKRASVGRAIRALCAFTSIHFRLEPITLVSVSFITIHRIEYTFNPWGRGTLNGLYD